jgi:hypothetical protein
MLAHLPAAAAGVSFMAATIWTATFLRVESPCYSTPSIVSSVLPCCYIPPNGGVAAPGYPNPGPPICWPFCQLSALALEAPPHVYYYPGGCCGPLASPSCTNLAVTSCRLSWVSPDSASLYWANVSRDTIRVVVPSGSTTSIPSLRACVMSSAKNKRFKP